MGVFLQNEEWKPVKKYKGKYEVSNFGQVRSLRRIVSSGNNGYRTIYEKILKQRKDKDSYMILMLCNLCKEKIHKVHRLVAEAFLLPSKSKNAAVNHIDSDWEAF